MAARAAYGARVEASAVVGDGEDGAGAATYEDQLHVRRVGVPQGVVQCLLCDAQQGLFLGRGEGAYAVALEGDLGGVRAVEDLGLGTQGGDETVLVQRGGAHLDDGGAQLVHGLGRQPGDLVQLRLGAGRVTVDESGGGLGGEAEGEELLGDGVVQFVPDAGALAA